MPHMNRATSTLLLVPAILAFLTPTAQAADAPPRKPNIVFILADDLGYGDLACYGQQKIQTPHIDRLAADGLRFTQAYAGATVCAPSRCSLMTGLHGGHARIRGNKRVPLQPQDVTVADVLKKAGYATALCGKWGLGQPDDAGAPNKHGFDHFFGYADQYHAHNYYPAYLWRNDQKFPLANVMPTDKPGSFGQGVAVEKKQWSHDVIAAEAISWIKSNQDKPFFLYLALTLPHANNEAGNAGMEVPTDAPYSDKPWPQPEKGKAAMITRLDATVGQVMALLKDLKLDDDTIVIFTSDNGPHNEGGVDAKFFQSSGPLRGTKRDLYEGGIRVPMIARWPNKIAPGKTTDFPTAFWDFLPTAADLAGATDKLPPNLDGQSILPTLQGKPQKPHDHLYFEFHERGFDQAVRFGNWKAVRNGFDQPLELYDLKADLGETTNLAPSHPDVIKQATDFLAAARTDSPDFPIDKRPRKPAKPK
jgi:arylsulfatase A-like enzyme